MTKTQNTISNRAKVVLFDLDDTLYDYKNLKRLADNTAFSVIGSDYSKKASDLYEKAKENLRLLYTKKQITHNQFYDRRTRYSILLDLLGIENTGLDIKMDDTFWKAIKKNIKPFDNSKKVLSDLEKFYKLGIITNGLKWQQQLKLKHLNMTDYFDYFFTSEDAGIEKPNREFFEYVLNKFNDIQCNECMVVGNEPIDDIMGAKNAGMKTIFLNNKADLKDIVPDYEINDIRQLKGILL